MYLCLWVVLLSFCYCHRENKAQVVPAYSAGAPGEAWSCPESGVCPEGQPSPGERPGEPHRPVSIFVVATEILRLLQNIITRKATDKP